MITEEKTARFFDQYASGFNAIYGNDNTLVNRVVNTLFRQSMKQRYLLTLQGCNPIAGRSVLDIGCGPGHYSVELARRGARRVLGLDFADGMLEIARKRAVDSGVSDICNFQRADFLTTTLDEQFDYVIVMGFMDYIKDPRAMIEKTLSATAGKAFFSFPLDGGLLARQRQVRYRFKCDLYLYTEDRVRSLFEGLPAKIDTQNLKRDLFVTATVQR